MIIKSNNTNTNTNTSSFQSFLSDSSPQANTNSNSNTNTKSSDTKAMPGPVEFRRINSKQSPTAPSRFYHHYYHYHYLKHYNYTIISNDVDYGPIPNEPLKSDDTISIAIRLPPPNKMIRRLFLKKDKARCLFAVVIIIIIITIITIVIIILFIIYIIIIIIIKVLHHYPEARLKPFDLCTTIPIKNLRAQGLLDSELGDLDLDNSVLSYKS